MKTFLPCVNSQHRMATQLLQLQMTVEHPDGVSTNHITLLFIERQSQGLTHIVLYQTFRS